MKNKALALVLCGFMAVLTASCGNSRGESSSAEVSETQEVTTRNAEFDEAAVEFLKSFYKTAYDDGDEKAAIKYVYPSAIVEKSFTNEGRYATEFGGSGLPKGYKLTEFKVDKCEPLTKSQLKGAEIYFEDYAVNVSGLPDTDYTVLDGREISFTATFDGELGSKDFAFSHVVVDIEGEGYKIATSTASRLDELAG